MTAVVVREYCPKELGVARILCMSDTHGLNEELGAWLDRFRHWEVDLLLHAGDFSQTGSMIQLERFAETMKTHGSHIKWRYVIAGNHELTLDAKTKHRGNRLHTPQRRDISRKAALDVLKDSVIYVENELVEGPFGLRIFGSPYTPQFCNWGFGQSEDEGHTFWKQVALTKSSDQERFCDILMTHGPPQGTLDSTWSGISVGCPSLSTVLPELNPRLHVFGHIHESHGVHQMEHCDTLCVNASLCSEKYDSFSNKPIIVDLSL